MESILTKFNVRQACHPVKKCEDLYEWSHGKDKIYTPVECKSLVLEQWDKIGWQMYPSTPAVLERDQCIKENADKITASQKTCKRYIHDPNRPAEGSFVDTTIDGKKTKSRILFGGGYNTRTPHPEWDSCIDKYCGTERKACDMALKKACDEMCNDWGVASADKQECVQICLQMKRNYFQKPGLSLDATPAIDLVNHCIREHNLTIAGEDARKGFETNFLCETLDCKSEKDKNMKSRFEEAFNTKLVQNGHTTLCFGYDAGVLKYEGNIDSQCDTYGDEYYNKKCMEYEDDYNNVGACIGDGQDKDWCNTCESLILKLDKNSCDTRLLCEWGSTYYEPGKCNDVDRDYNDRGYDRDRDDDRGYDRDRDDDRGYDRDRDDDRGYDRDRDDDRGYDKNRDYNDRGYDRDRDYDRGYDRERDDDRGYDRDRDYNDRGYDRDRDYNDRGYDRERDDDRGYDRDRDYNDRGYDRDRDYNDRGYDRERDDDRGYDRDRDYNDRGYDRGDDRRLYRYNA